MERHMKARQLWLAAIGLVLLAAPAFAQQSSPAGRIKVVSGSAFIVRSGGTIRAEVGQTVFESDSLRTGEDGRIGVTLDDDTRLSLGPSSEVRLNSFSYAPAQGSVGLAMSFLRGIAVYVSGQIAKLAPDSVRLETPSAIVGVRGTTLALHVVPE
jgi:hypothetical protein